MHLLLMLCPNTKFLTPPLSYNFKVSSAGKIELLSRLLTNSVLRIVVSSPTLAFTDGNHKHHHFLLDDLIDQPVASAA